MLHSREVTALQKGTVIDHLPAGKGLAILSLIGLSQSRYQIMLGMNLASERYRHKDLIKIAKYHLPKEQISYLGILVADATVSYIDAFEVIRKVKVQIPQQVKGILKCPNPRCVTQVETTMSCFTVTTEAQEVILRCHYCERRFLRTLFEE